MYLAGHQWVIWKCFSQKREDFRVKMFVLQKVSKVVHLNIQVYSLIQNSMKQTEMILVG